MAEVTGNDILDIFAEKGADPHYESDEEAHVRAARIAEEVNSGQRSLAEASGSIQQLADRADAAGWGNQWTGGGYTDGGSAGVPGTPGGINVVAGTVTDWGTSTTTPGGAAIGDTAASRENQRREMELIYGWLPTEALDMWLKEWIESGNTDAAWATIRQSDEYQYWFPGNRTEDGRVRYSEEQYAAVTASYDDAFRAVGLNPENFQGRYGELIEGEVAPDELVKNRIMPMYERIIEGSTAIKKWYSQNYGLEMTTEALLAGALDPDLGQKILNKQIGMAEIGGEAKESGFGIAEGFVEKLYEAGLNREQADQMFQNAEAFVPVLNTLAARHADVDDDFDLKEFVSADLFGDPTQRSRMRRLVAQERSTFSGGQLGAGAAQSRTTGGLTGLTER